MLQPLTSLILGLGVSVFAFCANAVLVSISYAVAALRFEPSKSASTEKLSKLEKRLLNKSKRLGTFVTLGIRFFIALMASGIFFVFVSIFGFASWHLSPLRCALLLALAFLVAFFVEYALCDLPFASFATKFPMKALRRYSKPYLLLFVLAFPFEFIARKISSKLFGKTVLKEGISFDHIDVLVKLRSEEEESDELTPYARKIVRNSIRLNELEISDVMIPRSSVQYFDVNAPLEENLQKALKFGHTRYPLCDGNLDNCLGIIHIKDIFKALRSGETIDLMKLKRGILRVRHSEAIIDTLSKLRRHELHMAFVEDEFGGIIGIITLNEIVEEIVGQIKEEFEDPSDSIRRSGKNTFQISGMAAIHNVEDALEVDFENDEVSTFGGLITWVLGRFPEKGERILLSEQNLRVTIEQVSARRIIECKVERLQEPQK